MKNNFLTAAILVFSILTACSKVDVEPQNNATKSNALSRIDDEDSEIIVLEPRTAT